jgi:hypothetical protein
MADATKHSKQRPRSYVVERHAVITKKIIEQWPAPAWSPEHWFERYGWR